MAQTETADKTGTTEAIEKTPKKQKKSKRSVWKYILIANTVILTGILAWIFFSAMVGAAGACSGMPCGAGVFHQYRLANANGLPSAEVSPSSCL